MPPGPLLELLPLTVLSLSFSAPKLSIPAPCHVTLPPLIVTPQIVADTPEATVTTGPPPLIVVRPAPAPSRLTLLSIVKPPL